MPIYEYRCEKCSHTETRVRSMDRRHCYVVCPVCGAGCPLVPSIPGEPWIQGVSNIHQGWSKDVQDPLFEPDGEV